VAFATAFALGSAVFAAPWPADGVVGAAAGVADSTGVAPPCVGRVGTAGLCAAGVAKGALTSFSV